MSFLLQLVGLFVLARVLGEVCERLRVPALIGEIFAGLFLGPLVLGFVTPGAELRLLADLGVFFIVYEAGMEMTFRGVRRVIRESGAAVAAGSFTLPFLLGFLLGLVFGFPLPTALFLGLALSLTALPVSVRVLTDLGWVQTDVGQTIITAGLLCDVAGLVVLAILSNWTEGLAVLDPVLVTVVVLKIVLFFLVVFLVERLLRQGERRLSRVIVARSESLLSRGAHFSVPLLMVLGFSLLAELLGLHFVIGAFFGTVIVAEHLYPPKAADHLRESIGAVSHGFLAPLFFAYLGVVAVTFDPALATLFAVLLAAAAAGKVAGSYLGARLAGFVPWSASVIAVGMNGRGAMELVIALIGLEIGLVSVGLFSLLVLVGLVTTLMTPFILRKLAAMPDGPGSATP